MSRRAAAFTQADIARAIRAVVAETGGPVVVELGVDKTIRVRQAEPDKTPPARPIPDPEIQL